MSTPAPVGLQLAVVFVASLTGFAGGIAVAAFGAISTLVLASFVCLALFLVARISADHRSTATSLVLLGIWAFACTLLMPALGEIVRPRRISRDLAGVLGALLRLSAAIAVAGAAPTAAVILGLRRAAPAEPFPAPQSRSLGPAGAQLLTGLAVSATALVLLALTLLIRDPAWRIAAVLLLLLAGPALTLLLEASGYRIIFLRHAIAAPAALAAALEAVRDRTGVSFGRVICLEANYGGGRICLVIAAVRSATLVISSELAERLTPAQLVAVLAHEAAHARFRHGHRRLAWTTGLTLVSVGVAITFLHFITPLFPRSFGFLPVFFVLFPLLVARQLYEALVTRRHESEADAFAVHIAGAGALLDALAVIEGAAPAADAVHHRWTTHGTHQVRAARIREFERQAVVRSGLPDTSAARSE